MTAPSLPDLIPSPPLQLFRAHPGSPLLRARSGRKSLPSLEQDDLDVAPSHTDPSMPIQDSAQALPQWLSAAETTLPGMAAPDTEVTMATSASTASATDASGSATAAGATALSPLAIGAGVAGVLVLAAASNSGGHGTASMAGNGTSNHLGSAGSTGNDAHHSNPGHDIPAVNDTPDIPGLQEQAASDVQDSDHKTSMWELPGTDAPTPDPASIILNQDTQTAVPHALFEEALQASPSAAAIRIRHIEASESEKRAAARFIHQDADNGRLTAFEMVEITEGLTLQEARAEAIRLGGKLATIGGPLDARSEWIGKKMHGIVSDLPSREAYHFEGSGQAQDDMKRKYLLVEYEDYKQPLLLTDANGKVIHLEPGSIIRPEDFHRISWDSSLNNEGAFSFFAIDHDGKLPRGGTHPSYSISLMEKPAPAESEILIAPNAVSAIDKGSFGNSVPGKSDPAFIKITNLQVAHDDDKEQSITALFLDDDNGTPSAVQVGQVLSQAELGKLSWNSLFNNGGTLHFIEVQDKDGNLPAVHARQSALYIYEQEDMAEPLPPSPAFPAGAQSGACQDSCRLIHATCC